MIKTIAQQIYFGTPEYDESYQLRNDILRKPLKRTFYIEDIQLEYNDVHLALYNFDNYEMIGILILTRIDDRVYKMRQVAIKNKYQNLGLGRVLVKYAEDFSLKSNVKTIDLNARLDSAKFYEKLNYKKEGEIFMEVGIKHIRFTKKLS